MINFNTLKNADKIFTTNCSDASLYFYRLHIFMVLREINYLFVLIKKLSTDFIVIHSYNFVEEKLKFCHTKIMSDLDHLFNQYSLSLTVFRFIYSQYNLLKNFNIVKNMINTYQIIFVYIILILFLFYFYFLFR